MADVGLSEKRRKRLEDFVSLLRVKPGSRVTLAKDFAPGFKAGVSKKKDGVALLNEGIELLTEYQARLAAQDTWGVLVVLQAMDAAGKDGTIRHVMSGVTPQGVAVRSFKAPSADARAPADVAARLTVDPAVGLSAPEDGKPGLTAADHPGAVSTARRGEAIIHGSTGWGPRAHGPRVQHRMDAGPIALGALGRRRVPHFIRFG